MITRSFWSMPSWYLYSVAYGESVTAAESATGSALSAGQSDEGELFAWSGFQVTLYKDACERYWHALIGDKPQVYVVCRDTEEEEEGECNIRPVIVTIDYDEATACAETDELVLSGPIPAELYRYMESFVLEHYQPKEFKKRKRRKWSEDEDQGRRPGRG